VTRDDLPDLSARLAQHIAELARDLAGEPMHRGRTEWRYRGRDGGAEALRVFVDGPKRGGWTDFHADAGGDALAFVAHLRRVPLHEAIFWARGWLGEERAHRDTAPRLDRPRPPPETQREPPATLDAARRIWRECVAAEGTLAETYLAARGLQLEPGAPLRFHPACPRGEAERLPAMVALMSDPATGTPCGLHRTFLEADGRDRLRDRKGRAMLGRAGVVRLVPDTEVTAGLGLAEGIETALAVMQGFAWRPVWAATSAGALSGFPVLPSVEALTIWADPDGAGLDAAETCAARWVAAGREARICTPPRGDFNDLIRSAA
jgi:putative DNA primase/helicase